MEQRDDDQEASSVPAAPEHEIGTLVLATSGVEGWAEHHILDLLRSDLVPRDVGNTACAPQDTIDPHNE
ncbi:MAG TPA: hypothetical protein VFQ77_14595 [Pseudonocardiaceae bacterium]|nr:hypothetical protein [Pseudonocardiaceae bacterium]